MKKFEFDVNKHLEILLCIILSISAIANIVCLLVLSYDVFKVVRIILSIPYFVVAPFSPFALLYCLTEMFNSERTEKQRVISGITLFIMIVAAVSVIKMFIWFD